MTNGRINLSQQWQTATDVIQKSEQFSARLRELESQITEHGIEYVESVKQATQQAELERDQKKESVSLHANQQRNQINESTRQHLDSVAAQHRQTVYSLTTQTQQQLTELEERRSQEDWILNSVLDENQGDSPIVECERLTEAFVLHHESFQESRQSTGEAIKKVEGYLSECHAGAAIELPPPIYERGTRDEVRETAAVEFSNVATQLNRLYEYKLPSVVRGLRIWGLSLLSFVVLWLPIVAIREDLTTFVNGDLQKPNYEWAVVAAGISAAIVGFTALILILMVQSRLRGRFSDALQSLSNARAASNDWEKRTSKQINKLEVVAEKYEAEMIQHRAERLQTLKDTIDGQVEQVRKHAAEMTAGMTQQLNAATVAAEQNLKAHLLAIDEQMKQQVGQIEQEHQQELQERLANLKTNHLQATAELSASHAAVSNEWNSVVEQFTRYASDANHLVQANRRLPNAGQQWQLPSVIPSFAPLGDLLVTTSAISSDSPPASASGGQFVETVTKNLCVEMPALLPFPSGMSICVQHDAAGRDTAVSFLRRQILTAITRLPAGRFRLTLIDPIGLGQSFSALMHLADFDEMLIHSRIWTESRQIREQLQKVTEHMENVFQTYLRSEFDSIEDYNKSAGEVAEPYHFVVVAGFPNAFTEESAMALSSILTSGPRCGVHAMIAWNPAMDTPSVFDNEELIHHCTNFAVKNNTVHFVGEIPSEQSVPADRLLFEADPEPPTDEYVKYVRRIGDLSKNARRVEVSFSRIAPAPDQIWTHSTADGIDLPIGRAGAARLQYMRLGRGTSQHVLVAGKTGSGKSTFLHIVITNLALHYSPSELQFYLIDFKKGVEFRTYAANHLPHARVVAIESDREFGMSVLEKLDQILQERGELFRERGVQDVPAFRSQFPNEPMPRLMLLIDEFQEFFVSEDRVSSRASLLLDRLVRQGRAFGVHVLLGSQTLGGAYSLARSTMGQIAVRIALQCSENDAHLILSEDNSAARLLARPGEAIYNDANGLVQGNNTFQIAWLEDERRQEAIDQLNQRQPKTDHAIQPMIVFEGNVPPVAETCGPLNAWLKNMPDTTSRSFDGLDIWLGEPLAIAAPTQVQLRRAGGQNVVIVGQDEKMVNSLLAFTMLSSAFRRTAPLEDGQPGPASRMTLLLDRTDTDFASDLMDLGQRCPAERLSIGTTADTTATMQELIAEIVRREESSDHVAQATWVLAIRNVGQFRDLKKAEDDFGMGGFGEPKPETAASQFADVIKRGPNVGIHVVLWSDTFSNAIRWLSNSLLREFETRIAFRLNQTDSSSLVDSPVAAGLENGRAIIYRDQTGTTEKFRPFAWPSTEWLDQLPSDAHRTTSESTESNVTDAELPSAQSSEQKVAETNDSPQADADGPDVDGPDINALNIE